MEKKELKKEVQAIMSSETLLEELGTLLLDSIYSDDEPWYKKMRNLLDHWQQNPKLIDDILMDICGRRVESLVENITFDGTHKTRKVSKVTFDLYLYGKSYEGVEVDFSDEPVDEDYLHSEDGPWAGIEVDGKCYDVQIWDDPVENECGKYVPSSTLRVSLVDSDRHWIDPDDVDSENFILEYVNQ